MNYDDIINRDVAALKPSGIRKFFDVAAAMPDAISLGVGEPDFVTPWEIRDAAIKSVQKGYTAYTSNMGLAPLREAVGDYLGRFDLSYGAEEILITVGASEAIDLSLRTLVNPGEEVLVPEPCFVSYAPNVVLSGGCPKPIRTGPEEGFVLTPQALEKVVTPRSKVLILSYPNNPTGAIMTQQQLSALLPVVERHNLIVISDEIYAELTYGAKHVSIASLAGMRARTVVISGFSKAFAMTGWRIGYVAAPLPILKAMLKIHQYTIMCASTMSQHAALAALKTGEANGYEMVEEMRDTYDRRRRFMVSELRGMGLECFDPQGAFYVFPRVRTLGVSGSEFADRLLRTQHVVVVPGDAFGECGADFVRCSYATSMQQLDEAIKRMRSTVDELRKANR